MIKSIAKVIYDFHMSKGLSDSEQDIRLTRKTLDKPMI